MTTKWTKFSEMLPDESRSQVFVLWPVSGLIEAQHRPARTGWHDWRASECLWHPITYPEPPKPLPQEARDAAAFAEWEREASFVNMVHAREAWDFALRYERAEVAKLVDEVSRDSVVATFPSLTRLRKRVGLDK